MESVDDMSIALYWMQHIDYPCVEPKTGMSIRYFHIQRAKEALQHLKNPFAISLLEDKTIRRYWTK